MTESETPAAAEPPPTAFGSWHDARWGRWAGVVVLLLALGLYLTTLDTGLRPDELVGGDLITHQYAQIQARPSNAPGYPLYTMGGWLWFRLTDVLRQALNPVQRLASYSTLWALLALFVLYHLLRRLTRGNWVISALLTLFYAVTYFFWYYSVTTEQYTSAIFQTLLIVWLAFKWDDAAADGCVSSELVAVSPHPPALLSQLGLGEGGWGVRAVSLVTTDSPADVKSTPADRWLLALAFVVGTCAANMLTTLFIVPPLVGFVLSRRTGLLRRPRTVLALVLVAALPLLSYAYVYLRGAAHPEWWGQGDWPTAGAWFLDFLTTRQGRDELAPGLTLANFFTTEFPALIWREMTLPVLLGGVIGLFVRPLRWRRGLFLGATLLITLIFCWAYRFGNWYQVILPAYPLLLLGLAALLETLWQQESRLAGWRRALLTAALLVLVIYRFAVSLPRADQSHRAEDTGLDAGWALLV
jgi:hypothetical protein